MNRPTPEEAKRILDQIKEYSDAPRLKVQTSVGELTAMPTTDGGNLGIWVSLNDDTVVLVDVDDDGKLTVRIWDSECDNDPLIIHSPKLCKCCEHKKED